MKYNFDNKRDCLLRKSASPEITRMLNGIAPGTHIVLIYDSPESKRDILFSHLALGVENSKLVYVSYKASLDKVKREMKESGIDAKHLERSGRLAVLDYEQVYLKDDKIDIPQAIGHLSHMAWSCKKENLDGGLRVAEERSGFLRRKMFGDLAMYERRLHRTFFFPATTVCAYDLTEVSTSGNLESLLALHSKDRLLLTGPNGFSVMEPKDVQDAIKITV